MNTNHPPPTIIITLPCPKIFHQVQKYAKLGPMYDGKLENLLSDFYWSYKQGTANSPLEVRLELYTMGAVKFCKELITSPIQHSLGVISWCFYILADAASVVNGNDLRENITVEMGTITENLLPLAMAEFQYQPKRLGGILLQLAFTIINTACSVKELTPILLRLGLHTLLVNFLQEQGRSNLLASTMSRDHLKDTLKSLSWLAWHCPHALRHNTQALELAKQYVSLLENHDTMLIGFIALRVVLRISSCDHDRPPATKIDNITQVIQFYATTLSRALQSGPKLGFLVYESNWNLGGLCCDLAMIATMLEDHSSLATAITPVLQAIYLYGERDLKLITYTVTFLNHIHHNPICLNELILHMVELRRLQQFIEEESTFTSIERVQINNVMISIENHFAFC
jgi:hypothetical protein